jgi:hypothetical protein
MSWRWIIGAALLGVAAISVYTAFQTPTFVWGILAAILLAVARAVIPPITRPMTPDDTKAKNEAYRRGQGDEWLRKRNGSLKD